MWDLNAFYQVMNTENEACKKALEILTSPGLYESILNKKKK
jgi:hypothetical protein